MSYCDVLHEKVIKKSRKIHYCSWCGEEILVGSTYVEFANVYEGNFNCNTFHPECWDASGRHTEESGAGEYELCANHRGMTEEEWETAQYKAEKENALVGATI